MSRSKGPEGRYTIQYPLSQFLDTIKVVDAPATTRDIANKVGCSFDTAAAKLKELEDFGEVSRTRDSGTTIWVRTSERKEIDTKDIDTFCTHIDETSSLLWESVDPTSISDIGSSIRVWMNDHGFDQVDRPLHVFSRLASYNFILKCTTYLDYQIQKDGLPPLDPLPSNIFQQFELAADTTGNPAFNSNPLDFIVESAPEYTAQPLIHISYHLRNAENPTAVIGEMYEQIIPKSGREKRGQFRTPSRISDTLSEWAIEKGDDSILDPGAGAGVLSAAAYESKKRLEADIGINDIWSIDISSLSILMTASALQLTNGDTLPNIHQSDFLETKPRDDSGDEGSNTSNIRLPKFDVIISNPPYTRSKNIDDSERLRGLIEEETGKNFDPKTPLYQYFIVHASQFLKSSGRMAIITSSSFLDANYGTEFQEYLLSEFKIDGLVQLGPEIEVFNADVSTVLLFLTKTSDDLAPDAETALVRLQSWPGRETVLDIVDGTQDIGDAGDCEFALQSNLEPGHNWISSIGWEPNPLLDTLPDFDSIADISRGVATGKNDFFCINREDIDEWDIPDKFCQPILRRPRHAPHYTYNQDDRQELINSNEESWVLDCQQERSSIEEVENSSFRAYLEYGEEIGAHDSVLASRRSQWYDLPDQDPADIVVPYMNRGRIRFVANQTDAITLNNLHAIHLQEYTAEEEKALLAYLNSNTAGEVAIKTGRSYNRGLKKLELSDLRSLPVLDPGLLDESQLSDLADAFEALEDASREEDSLKEAEILAQIDTVVAEILQTLQE